MMSISCFHLSTFPLVILLLLTFTVVTFPPPTHAAYNSSQIINFNCTAGQYCLSPDYNATQKIQCPLSYYCPGGQSGQFCPRGYYCPTPLNKIPCPEGYYCPPASITPRSCSGLEYCPQGSSRYVSIGGIVLMVLLLPLILICTFIYNRYQGGKQKQAPPTPTDTPKDGSSPFGESSHNVAAVDELNIQFEHLRAGIKVDKVEKILIDDISGEFSAGRLTAIMGPSGAGKTTLISALMGKVPLLDGTVRINHAPDKLSHHRHAVGMVPQDDTMISSMTVHDILRHSADIRMPTRYDRDAREKRVDQVMELLGLSHVKNTVVGDVNVRGVSGGEKKRVNIGIELVANPRVLFLDEPTTGLDSTTSIDVTRVLRSIASLQVSVVAVLHQPRQEIFNLLDDLLLLAPGGKTVYFGPAKNTLNYFTKIGYPCPKNINPADYFIDVIAGKEGLPGTQRSTSPIHDLSHDEKETTTSDMEELANMHNNMIEHKAIIDYLTSQWEKYRDTATGKNAQPLGAIQEADEGTSEMTVVNPQKTHPTPRPTSTPTPASSKPTEIIHFPNFFRQIYLYTYRSILQLIRNHATVSTELTLHLVAGLVIGIAFVYDYWFIPPLDPAYQRFCPQPLQAQCYKQPVKEQIQLMTTYTVMALGLTAAVIGNRNFGQEKANFFRESETGMSTLAYFIGKCLGDLPLVTLYSFVYAVSFMTVAAPASTFADFYACVFLYEWCLFALGYVSSVMFDADQNGLLLSVVASLLGGLAVQKDSVTKLICWASWFGEPLFTSEVRLDLQPARASFVIQTYANGAHGFKLDRFSYNLWILFLYAMALRALAYIILLRKKRVKLGRAL